MNSGAHKADVRIATSNALKIQAALRQGIDAKRVIAAYRRTNPHTSKNPTQDRARARSWALLNMRINNEPLLEILQRTWADGFALGLAYGDEQVMRAREAKKAAQDYVDWDNWKPGDAATATLLRPPKAFQELLGRARVTIKDLDQTGYDRVGTALADSIEQGLSDTRAARLINDAIGSPARALTIAITETNRAMSYGAISRYKEANLEQMEWETSDPCPTCAMNGGVKVNIGGTFPSGAEMPPAHPHCRCALLPVIPDFEANENGVVDIAPKTPQPVSVSKPEELHDLMTYQRQQDFWAKTVPYDQEEALWSYTSNSYLNMQSVARTGNVALDSASPELLAKITKANDELASLISSAPPLSSDLVTYRGVQGDIANAYLTAKPGDIIKDKGFSSTSLLREKAEIYIDTPLPGSMAVSDKTAILEIVNPKGTKGVMVDAFQNDIILTDKIITEPLATAYSTRTQYEWLLNRNTSFEVISVNGSTVTVRIK